MFHPQAPGRIAADLPDVKLLVLLRDPVDRAYSAHAHEIARGFERLPFPRRWKQSRSGSPESAKGWQRIRRT